MELQSLFHAILLGIVEGLTEFIPVSSTGHLILLVDLLKVAAPPGKVFEIVIQLGAIFAICWAYRHRLCDVAFSLHHKPTSRHFVLMIIIAFLPAMLFGVLFHSVIKATLFSPKVVSISLIIGGIAILVIERFKPKPTLHDIQQIGLRQALGIGLFQCLAMIPGTSRSGATIMGSLMLGVDRKTATEFSFFLAIPTMLGAVVYDLYKNYQFLTSEHYIMIAVGFFTAFLAALLVVTHVIAFISKHGFMPFAYYRIVLGTIMLCLVI